MASKNDDDWREALFATLAATPEIEAAALRVARGMRLESDPEVQMADVTAARRYLRACIHRMSAQEGELVTDGQAAELWARGTLGAARYRAAPTAPGARNQQPPPARLRRDHR